MSQALDNTLDERLDSRTARRTLVLFAATFAVAVLVSPALAIYELFLGALGLFVIGMLTRTGDGDSRSATRMTATVIAAGVLAGSLPYLAAAALVV